MRLINTATLKLESFAYPDVPEYAILSHTWGKGAEEVSFQDLVDLETSKRKLGFSKIEKTCQLARDSKINYAWVDTCCIDKSSSTELSESINSMYTWYRKSKVCYVYIDDWPPGYDWANLGPLANDDLNTENGLRVERSPASTDDTNWHECLENILDSSYPDSDSCSTASNPNPSSPPLKWFTRGWTLQELIAPTKVEFYDQTWTLKGVKSDPVVLGHLSRITGVTAHILEDGNEYRLQDICLGQRMSWAACRKTTRTEDLAYCLLGIFQVNMPMLYGEGDKAFLRLQEEILKSSTDLSILAWTQHNSDDREHRGILSCHPREFAGLRNCVLFKSPYFPTEEITMTNKGLRICTSLFYISHNGELLDDSGLHFMYLGCILRRRPQGIMLKTIEHDLYERVEPKGLMAISSLMRRGEARVLYIARHLDNVDDQLSMLASVLGITVKLKGVKPFGLDVIEAWPPGLYDQLQQRILVRGLKSYLGFIRLAIIDRKSLPDSRHQVGEFLAVCCSTNQAGFCLCLLQGNQATAFTDFTKSIWNMDPITAERRLFAHFHSLPKCCDLDFTVEDNAVEKTLHVSAIRLAREHPAGNGWPERTEIGIRVGLKLGRRLH